MKYKKYKVELHFKGSEETLRMLNRNILENLNFNILKDDEFVNLGKILEEK